MLDTLAALLNDEPADQPSLDSVVSPAQVEAAYIRKGCGGGLIKSGNVFGVEAKDNSSFGYVQLLGGGTTLGRIQGGCDPGVKCYKSIKDIFAQPGQYAADVMCLGYEPQALPVLHDNVMQNSMQPMCCVSIMSRRLCRCCRTCKSASGFKWCLGPIQISLCGTGVDRL